MDRRASFAISRQVAERIRLDEELGPGALGFGDDDLMTRQIREAGFRLVAVAGLPAVHHFDPSRLTRDALLDKAEASGRSIAYISHHWMHTSRRTFGLRWAKHAVQLAGYRMLHRPSSGCPITDKEMSLVTEVAYNRQMMRESKRARNYERRGLRRLNSSTG